MKYPHKQQHDERDCGAACVSMILEYYGAKYSMAELRDYIKVDNQGASFYGIIEGTKKSTLKQMLLKAIMIVLQIA